MAQGATCDEQWPEGKPKPTLTERFPERAAAGHVATLVLTFEHGAAETVMPGGLQPQLDSPAAGGLRAAGFIMPSPDGPARPSQVTQKKGELAATTLTIPFVPLPKEPGRQRLTLPALPITIARASGELMTLCTKPHELTVEAPTANAPSPTPRENPKGRPQRELWRAARDAAIVAAMALALGGLVAWALIAWRRRPRALPPPPPPRPPWHVALEEFAALRAANLIALGRRGEHVDRASDALRKYLGGLHGFEGLESTTDEILSELRARNRSTAELVEVSTLLGQADLVKFAKVEPSAEDCVTLLERSEQLVRDTAPIPERLPPASVGSTAEGGRGA